MGTEVTARSTIAIVITGLDVGGAESMLIKLLSKIDRRRFELHVYSLMGQGPIQLNLLSLGIPTFVPVKRKGIRKIWAALQLIRTIAGKRYDLIQGWMYHGNIAATIAFILGSNRSQLVWNVRASLDEPKSLKRGTRTLIRVGGFLSRIPHKILFNSFRGRQQHGWIAGYSLERSAIVPNGFDCELFSPNSHLRSRVRQELRIDAGAIVIGLIARFHPMKDHKSFFRAAALLKQSVKNAVFVLAGEGIVAENPAISEILYESQLTETVRLLGVRDDVAAITNAFDIATCSSAGLEGFPNAIGEAMACGIPCVVTDVGDCAEIVGDTGVVVKPSSPESLAEAWNQLIALGPSNRRELGARARERILASYSIDTVTRQYEVLYDNLLSEAKCV